MRLQYLSLSGFRGFRESTRFDLGAGFTVLVGPNGSGKSTVCDAIEYALLGRIRPSSDHTEKGEGIHDYLWWRGAGSTKENYVELGLITEAGELHTIRRSPSTSSDPINPELRRALISEGTLIDDPFRQLCRTAVLRDEDITRLSVDLPEAERFSFVRAALGSADFAFAEGKARKVEEYLAQQLNQAQRAYEIQRNAVAELTARLSVLRAEAARATELDRVVESLRTLLASSAENLVDLAREAEVALAETRTRSDTLTRLYSELSTLQERIRSQTVEHSERQVASLSKQAAEREQELNAARAELDRVTALLHHAMDASPRTASLAQLQEHGSRLGLLDGHCPLCGIEQTDDRFASHLSALRELIETQNSELANVSAHAANARIRVESLQAEVSRLRTAIASLSGARAALLKEIGNVSRQLVPLGVTPTDDLPQTLQATAHGIESLRTRALELETALAALRASQAATQLADRELELDAARTRLTAAERTFSRLNSAEATIKESIRTIRRVQGELIDEQLAALSPLLGELFQRLRPHVDWQTVRYNLRGDVRRMLSLEVGDGLNPSFIFSSGQRRAAGLAFLLAIHLSRGWCGLRTLILDDPVQHVDDYRALHLTEVLSSIRRDHRQLVCTVEDPALAELLARRLRSQGDEPGALIKLRYEPRLGAHIVERRELAPHERRVLVAK